ncbi:uncharacterized protein LOC143613540 [Bidens hawaiensis]|uniref:uncharacterized protein LOC143613540 n=1 Tax=Bidens hawaiensis TaxID=980011 RepID=UPI0040499CC5
MEKNNVSSTRSPAVNSSNTTTSSSSDFVLQWGNRKRLRCMKVQQQQQQAKDKELAAGTPPVGLRSITGRSDRRVVRSPHQQNKEVVSGSNAVSNGHGHGYINLRQRSSSPAHRVLRNSENNSTAMKGQRGVCSPERGGAHDKRGAHHSTTHHHNNNGGGGSGSSEAAHDSKASPVNESVPMVWPPKFAIGLTNKEKEEDFLAIKGAKLPQRPKKRAKFIQRTINLVSPGGWLCDLTLERYEVREKKITKKKPRELKAMGGMESESEE